MSRRLTYVCHACVRPSISVGGGGWVGHGLQDTIDPHMVDTTRVN